MCTRRRVAWPHPARLLGALAPLLAACNGTSSYLDATGTAGRAEATLGRWLTGVACAVVVLVCLALLAGVLRGRDEPAPGRRREDGAATPPHDGTGRREVRSGLAWIYVGLAATVVVLLVTFAGTMVTLDAASHPPSASTLTLDVIGHQWWWELRYGDTRHPDFAFTTANEVHLPVGVPVRVRLRTADVIHSFWLPQLAGKTDVIPGQINETWLRAERPGRSRGMCGEYCGMQHATMALTVVAEPPQQFARWAFAQRAAAAPPATAEASAGRVVFARSCGACHAVAGSEALGRVGPDLTHLASRPTIGAGALPNTPEALARWVRDAPAVKRGVRMPAVPLDDAQLRAVVAYLRTLR